ncbi:MAG: Ice-binding protein [Frankiales bacterium]|nr:Ice-binding protein [Frankiales bacterium]
MTLRRSAAVLVAALTFLLAPTAAYALWSTAAHGTTSVTAATMANAGALTALCASAAPDSPVVLTWTASPDAYVDGYEIARSASPGGAQVTLTASHLATTLTDTPPVGGGLNYTYAIRATAGAWTTPWLEAAAAIAYSDSSCSPAPPILAPASASFSVLGGAGGVTSTGATSVSGNLGVSAGEAVVGFPPGEVAGTIHVGDATAAQAHTELTAAQGDLNGRTPTSQFDGDLGGLTLYDGVHDTAAAVALTSTLTLDAQGDPDAVFVFQVDAALNTTAASTVLLTNGTKPSNVYWQVEGAVGLGANSTFVGTILAAGAITVGDSAHLTGRALSSGAVTLANNTIWFSAAPPPTVAFDGGSQAITKDVTPTVTGTTSASAGRAVTVTIDHQTLVTTVGPGGAWSVTAAELIGGTYAVKASIRDLAGNAGSATQTLSVEVNPEPVSLLSATSFVVLGGIGGVTSTGTSEITGDVGVSAGQTIVGLTAQMVSGTIHAGDNPALQAHADRAAAYADAEHRTATSEFSGDLNGRTFRAGVHHAAAALALTGTLTLDAEGDPGAVFVIQVAAALNTAALSHVVLVNGALPANVFWQVQGAAGLGAGSTFAGTILAAGAITIGDGTQLLGRALAGGAVTLANSTVG